MPLISAMESARIESLMTKLNGETTQSCTSTRSTENNFVKGKPPFTLEEFLDAEKLEEWPETITSEYSLGLEGEKNLIGNQEHIYKQLKEATPLDMKFISDLEIRLTDLTTVLNCYGSQIIDMIPKEVANYQKEKKIKDDILAIGAPLDPEDVNLDKQMKKYSAFITDFHESDILKVHPSYKGKQKSMDFKETVKESKRRSIETCQYYGFVVGEVSELPHQMEAPQILNRITKAQDFNPGFKKFWKRIFQSEASVALLQDSFWWFFLTLFPKPSQSSIYDQDRLFDRIADSFVALFTSINPEIKDKFLDSYSDCLSQAVFATFREAFPESDHLFKNDFKEKLTNTIYQWFTGVRAPKEHYKTWKLLRLEPKVHRAYAEEKSKSKSMQEAATLNKEVEYNVQIEEFRKMVYRFGDANRIRSGNSRPGTKSRSGNGHHSALKVSPQGLQTLHNAQPFQFGTHLTLSRQAQCGTPKHECVESHPVGFGPQMERVLFNTQAQSPMVQHFLYMRHLKQKNNAGKKVLRTEITKHPEEKQTYRELLKERGDYEKKLSSEYKKVCEETSQEIARIEQHQAKVNRKIELLRRELSHSRIEDHHNNL